MTTPLDGTLVVDCTQGIAGPYCAMALGDAGADVIKVEPPDGDATRGWGPPFVDGEAAAYLSLNRNKRGVALDLGREEARDALRRLAHGADVFLEDWGPGEAEGMGLDYGSLSRDNPRLVYCSITPFGDEGPFRDRPGSELVAQAMGEAASSLGAIGEPPVRAGADLAGMSTGMLAVEGVLAALFARSRLGRGQRVTASMLGSLMFMRSTLWAAHSNPDEWWGFHLDSYVKPPDHGYQASDGQFYFAFTRGVTPERWVEFLEEASVAEHIDDHRFGNYRKSLGAGRYGYVLNELWDRAFETRTFDDLREMIERFDGFAWRLNDYDQLFSHPQVEASKLTIEVPHPNGGRFEAVGFPWEMEGTPASVRLAPPLLGQHTDEVLQALRYTTDEISQLRRDGAVR